MKLGALLASAASVLGVGWLVWRRGSSQPGILAPAPSAEDLPPEFRPDTAPVSVSAGAAGAHRGARPIVVSALRSLLKREPTIQEIQYGQAIGWLESSYGKGWSAKTVEACRAAGIEADLAGAQASNNWGAVQATGSQPGFMWCDSHPDGKKYPQRFRSYPTPEEGASDKLRHTFVLRPRVPRALAGNSGTVFRASLAMRRAVYYGGFCPKAIARYGDVSIASYKTPDRDEGTQACEREAVEMHAKRAYQIVREIASALGEPVSLPLGSFEDAMRWFRADKEANA